MQLLKAMCPATLMVCYIFLKHFCTTALTAESTLRKVNLQPAFNFHDSKKLPTNAIKKRNQHSATAFSGINWKYSNSHCEMVGNKCNLHMHKIRQEIHENHSLTQSVQVYESFVPDSKRTKWLSCFAVQRINVK